MRAKQLPPHSNRTPGERDFLDPTHPALQLLDLIRDAVVAADGKQAIVLFNQRAEAMFGYRAEEVLGKPLEFLLAAGRKEIRWRRKNGGEFSGGSSQSEIVGNGSTIRVYILQDITPPTVTEDVCAALREKEVLLEEVHHRVKNNLQVITSLLGLQARSIKDSATRIKFEESRYRIQAMAILHEILDESSSLAEIDFADYIQQAGGALGPILWRHRPHPHADPPGAAVLPSGCRVALRLDRERSAFQCA